MEEEIKKQLKNHLTIKINSTCKSRDYYASKLTITLYWDKIKITEATKFLDIPRRFNI